MKSYLVFVISICSIVAEFSCLILFHLQGYLSLMLFLIILFQSFVLIYLYDDINSFHGIYELHKTLKSIPQQKHTDDVLKNITFSQVSALRKTRFIEKRKVRQKIHTQDFSLYSTNSVGLIFYHDKNVHTFAIVVLISEKDWIIINGAFEKSIFHGRLKKQIIESVKQKFSVWVTEQDIRFRPLEFQQQSNLK